MSEKINSDHNIKGVFSSLISHEVEEMKKNNINESQRVAATVNSHYITYKLSDEKKHNDAPILRAPLEQEKSNEKIDLKSDSKYKIGAFSVQDKQGSFILKSSNMTEDSLSRNKKNELLTVRKNFYDDEKNNLLSSHLEEKKYKSILSTKQNKLSNKIENSPTPKLSTEPSKKENSTYDFLYLQLSYQNLIHQNILDKIKNTDKYEYYLNRLKDLSKGVDGLRENYKPTLDKLNKYKDAFIDYWMEINKEIKDRTITTESDLATFLANKNIKNSVLKDLLSKKINSRAEMESFLKSNFPFMNLPSDISKFDLSKLDNLYSQISSFLDNAFKFMPNVMMSEDKLNSISSHHNELNALINKNQDKSISDSLISLQEQYRNIVGVQSKIELEIMSDSLSGMALLTFLLAKVRELTMKVMLQRSESEQKLFDEMQDVTTRTLKEKIEDQKAQIKKQEEIQFWAGIGLKILGGLLTLVAGVAAIFTAGASLALVGVAVVMMVASVTLTVADEIYQAIHGSSFMEEAMKPISEAIGEAIDKIADFIVDMLNTSLNILKDFGMPADMIEKMKEAMKSKLKMAIKIITGVALLIGAVALSFVAGPASNALTSVAQKVFTEQVKETLKRILNDFLEAMLGKMIKQILIEAMEEMLKTFNKFLSKNISGEAFKTLNRTVVMSRLMTSGAANVINIYTATITDKIIRSVAESKKLEEILKVIQLLMDRLMESYHEQVESLTEMLNAMSEQSSISNKTKSNIIRNISI